MPVTPSGPISNAIAALATLIANVPFFQTWVGAIDSAHALASVYQGDVGYPIVSIAIAGGVLTVTTREPHQITAAMVVELSGASIGAESGANIAGPQTVVSVPTPTTFTAATALPDETTPQNPDYAFVFPGTRPLAVIQSGGLNFHSIGTGGVSVCAGWIEVLLEADVSSQYANDPVNAQIEMDNAVGNFKMGVMATQETGDLMPVSSCEITEPPVFVNRAEQNDNTVRFERWRALLKINWGLEG